MVQFIRQHGKEEEERIEKSMMDTYTVQSNQYKSDAKAKIEEEAKATYQKEEVALKIAKSKQQNDRRIERMKHVNVHIDQLRVETRAQINQKLSQDPDAYKELLKKLLLQGLIKLMEANIVVKCRAQDQEILEEIQDEVVSQYREMIVNEVKLFEGKAPDDIPCNIMIDKENPIESIDDNAETGSLGGINMLAKKGKIVLTQTIDSRIDLCFQAAIPAIRHQMFPSMRRPAKPDQPK